MVPQTLPKYKADFLAKAISESVIQLGDYSLKCQRPTPYFFNAGCFHRADLLHSISRAYAQTIIDFAERTNFEFDVLFGPAYKGVPLATAVVAQLAVMKPEKYGRISYSFNRKEAKGHGEKGIIVGAPIAGQRVLVIDDVVAAGTAMRESIDIIAKQGGTLAGIIVALDRKERMALDVQEDKNEPRLSNLSAIEQLKLETGVPILSILTLDDVYHGILGVATEPQIKAFETYREKYRAVGTVGA
ncbi:orotate phosphoribosyltransferase [Xylona heveae TC161]|uniref:Orotate phosphoribosyltransferase n=1 Tax=Xylona heveae (strain CBS 132557 / TC161) TaxID=1328760 RepID=A0A165HQ66_XYLHT|nr:orotate phosphoribosyltransferase [Xylona heveae TC161]KZF23824.1 orotate phosphoribosyltransferase [Xylona heveae TC161]